MPWNDVAVAAGWLTWAAGAPGTIPTIVRLLLMPIKLTSGRDPDPTTLDGLNGNHFRWPYLSIRPTRFPSASDVGGWPTLRAAPDFTHPRLKLAGVPSFFRLCRS